ncbi:MAG: hypothetical protein KAS16_06170 [Thermoplasmata archaeon]|nr:hypothetical protein [Thermoplasmata archaeon]
MEIKECLERASSLTVIRKYASKIVDNRNEKKVEEIQEEFLRQLDIVLASVPNNLHILEKNRSKRLLKPIILKILLEERNYQIKSKNLSEKIKQFEEEIINEAKTRDFFGKKELKAHHFDIYYTILEGAWEKDKDITEDEENILKKLRSKMNITLEEHWMLQAKLGIFPKPSGDCETDFCHNGDEVQTIAKSLHSEHLLIQIIGDNKEKYYIIPEEIASVIKKEWNIQLSGNSYQALLSNKKIFNKDRYINILNSAEIKPLGWTNNELIDAIKNNIKPTDALSTFVPKNELAKELEKACFTITGRKGSSKNDRINRIFGALDEISHKAPLYIDDKRERYYEYFEQLAARKHKELRDLKIIEKDLDIEKAFEEGTRYLFEKKLNLILEHLPGTDNPDGKIKINDDSVLLWDNKSKESACNLHSHLNQFHKYIRNTEGVQTFVVIAPEFDSKSDREAHIERAKNNVTFALVTAKDLKDIADEWAKSQHKNKAFPLSVFNIAGELELGKLKNAFKIV